MKLHSTLPEPPDFRLMVLQELGPRTDPFLTVKSKRLSVLHPEKRRSSPFIYDEVDRRALDAVVIVPHFVATNPSGQDERYIVLRSALRPPYALRAAESSPLGEPFNRSLWEMPAGLVETNERSASGIRLAAARELHEETGFSVQPEDLLVLGGSTLPAPGVIAERHYFFHVEVDPARRTEPPLDGSPLEEAGELAAVALSGCLVAMRAGRFVDAKTELCLRRLVDELAVSDGGLG